MAEASVAFLVNGLMQGEADARRNA